MFGNNLLKDTEKWKKIERKLGKIKADELRDAIEDAINQPPRLAVIGKAGVGKTTTINNLFDADWVVGEVDTGTRVKQEAEFEFLAGGKLAVVDMPGLGEDLENDEIYEEMYRNILPEVDLILYVMQANARDLQEDQMILKNIVIPSLLGRKTRIIIGLNKVDNIGPGNWIEAANYPSREQEKSINVRAQDIARKISSVTSIDPKQIIHYSALRLYRLNELAEALVIASEEVGWKLPLKPKNDALESIKNVMGSFLPWLNK